jgi:hypothetical protein
MDFIKLTTKIRKEMINKILSLSTGHMPNRDPDFGQFRVTDTKYGYIVWLCEDWEYCPGWLLPILDLH